jgi:uncharacterized membrane protein YfcA
MVEWPAIGIGAWALCTTIVVLGVLTQRATGGAFGMVVAPLVALVAPAFMPAGVLLVSLAVTLLCTPLPLGTIVWRQLAPMVAGRGAGAVLAAGLVALAPDPGAVAVLVAVAVLLGVAVSVAGKRVAMNRGSLVGAGLLSGLTGTLTSVGAPPVLLLYQDIPAEKARPTLNAFFLLGVALSLAALASRGRIGPDDAGFALSMAPAIAMGFAVARPVLGLLRGRSIRPLVLGLASVASVLILLRWVPGWLL